MPSAFQLPTWVVITLPLGTAILGAIASHLFRDFRDRPILDLSLESLHRARGHLSMPADLFAIVRLQGSFHFWLDKIVKWSVKCFDNNKFTVTELRDTRYLAPLFLEDCRTTVQDAQAMLATLQQPRNPPTDEQRLTLARMRSYWLERHGADVFEAWTREPDATAQRIAAKLTGDVHQREFAIKAVERMVRWLDEGLAPSAPTAIRLVAPVEEPSDPRKPFLFVNLLARNRGKTQVLVRDTATLRVGGITIHLKGVEAETGFGVFHGKYYRISPSEITELRFAQDPERTTLKNLQDVAALLSHGASRAVFTIIDYDSRRTNTRRLLFREAAP